MKSRFKVIAAGCATIMTSSAASADTYRYLSKDDEGSATFIDETTLNRNGDIASVWLLTLAGKYLAGGSPKPAYYLLQQSLNCRTQRIRPSAMSTYDERGVRLASDDAGGEEGSIEPGTIEQDVFKIACLRQKTAAGRFQAESPHRLAREFRADLLKLGK